MTHTISRPFASALAATAALCLPLVAASSASGVLESPHATPAATTPAAAPNGIYVQGNEVRRGRGDGTSYKFKTRGVIFEGFQFPLEAMQACTPKPGITEEQKEQAARFCERHVEAQNYYFHQGQFAGDPSAALDLAEQNWGANTIRFNVGQAALDPESALYQRMAPNGRTWGANYLARIKQAVALARSKNLVVILALFNYRLDHGDLINVGGRTLNSYDEKSGLPTYRTKRAMSTLAAAFRNDNEVLLEAYNEPWGNAGHYLNGHDAPKVAGLNAIIGAARDEGKGNPIIVQGLSGDLSAFPYGQLNDPKVIFSSHPFLGNGERTGDGDANWARLFGQASLSHPVILTAWNAEPEPRGASNTWCVDKGPWLAGAFVDNVVEKGLGLVGFAFDVRFTMTRDFLSIPRDQPTSIDSDCTGGGGAHIQDLFSRLAGG